MVFENDHLRIGPTGVQKERFLMPGKNGKLRFGKRFEIPEYLHQLDLTAYEFPAGRMAKFADSLVYKQFRQNAKKFNIAISIHAPYYISLTSVNPETYESSIGRVANVYAWAVWLNAKRIVLHPGSYGKDRNPAKLLEMIEEGINRGIDLSSERYPNLRQNFKDICLCPETMGKHGQLGTVDEVIEICKTIGLDKCRPCIDFGHIYARNLGKLKGTKLYEKTFNVIESELGKDIVENLHIHYSKIEYTPKGEKKHYPNTTKEWGPEIDPLFKLCIENGYNPIIINESPDLDPDAQILMKKWKSLN